MSIEEFFSRFKKGSKRCRAVLTTAETDTRSLTSVVSFFKLADILIPDLTTLSSTLSLWNLHFLPNKFREFIFKFFNNKLGLNVRLSHFTNTYRYCTFCVLEGRPSTDENFIHLFFYCPTVSNIHDTIDNTCLGERFIDVRSSKQRWLGFQTLNPNNTFKRLIHLAIQYFIWDSKLCNKIPNANWVLGESLAMLDSAIKLNAMLRNNLIISNYPIAVHWDQLAARRPWQPP